MTPEQITAAACDVYESQTLRDRPYWERAAAVFAAGMAVGRAEALADAAEAKTKRRKAATVDAEPKATVTVADMMHYGVPKLAAEDWLRVRRQHKAPLTRTAWEATKREADAARMTIGAAVQMCAERGWRGFRAEYVQKVFPQDGGNQHARHGRMDRQLETAALMTGAARQAPTDMGEIYDVGQQRITRR